MFFTINFGAIQNAVDDPGITPRGVGSEDEQENAPPPGRGFGRINVEPLLDAGFGVATLLLRRSGSGLSRLDFRMGFARNI